MLFQTLVNLPKKRDFFIFGARGTGKSTLLKTAFGDRKLLRLDLLLPKAEDRYLRDPESLIPEVEALPEDVSIVALDEVQRVPKLLDVVHHLTEEKKSYKQFSLT